jgi:hypothetical protein
LSIGQGTSEQGIVDFHQARGIGNPLQLPGSLQPKPFNPADAQLQAKTSQGRRHIEEVQMGRAAAV